jgi:hypothetical protein
MTIPANTLPLILETMSRFKHLNFDWLENKTFTFSCATKL